MGVISCCQRLRVTFFSDSPNLARFSLPLVTASFFLASYSLIAMAAEKPAPTENGRRQSTRKRLHEEKLTAGSSSSRETAPTQHEFINAVNWSRQDFEKIIDYVKTNGFYGDYKALLRELPHLTETSLRNLFQQLSRSTDFGNEQSFASSSSVPETLGSRKKSNKKSNMER